MKGGVLFVICARYDLDDALTLHSIVLPYIVSYSRF